MAELHKSKYSLLIVITAMAVFGMVSMLPGQERLLPEIAFRYVPYGEMGDVRIMDPRDEYFFDEFAYTQEAVPNVIDDAALSQFMKTYIEDLNGLNMTWSIPTENREMVRNMLEDMGYYNISKLKSLLNAEKSDKVMVKIINLLQENLFEEDMDMLNNLLIK